MKLNSIKDFVKSTSVEELKVAQDAIENHRRPEIFIPGDNSNERLTHIMIALWIKDDMEKNHHSLAESIRLFSKRVKMAFGK